MYTSCLLCPGNTGCILSSQAHATPIPVRTLELQRQEIVFSEGSPAETVFVVRSGSVRMTLSEASGGTRIVRFVRPGEVLGLDALLSEKIRVFTAITREQSTLCAVTRFEFEQFVKQDGERLWRLFLQFAAEIFGGQVEKLELSGDRVADRLRNIMVRIRSSTPIGIKQWELAQFLGVPEETISRQMKVLRGHGAARNNLPPKSVRKTRSPVLGFVKRNETLCQ